MKSLDGQFVLDKINNMKEFQTNLLTSSMEYYSAKADAMKDFVEAIGGDVELFINATYVNQAKIRDLKNEVLDMLPDEFRDFKHDLELKIRARQDEQAEKLGGLVLGIINQAQEVSTQVIKQ